MRRTACLTLLATAMMAGLQPAAAQGPRATLGVLAGWNLATVSQDDQTVDTDYKNGVLGGVFLSIPIGTRGFIEPQVLYSQKGTDLTFDATDLGSIRLSYIEVPVLLGVNLGMPESAVRPALYIGGAVSFKSKCTATFSSGSIEITEDCSDDPDLDEFKSTDFGGIGGARLDFRAGKSTVRVGAQYEYGFSNLNDSNEKAKNRVISIYVGIGVGIGN